jgi:hypothetical protein
VTIQPYEAKGSYAFYIYSENVASGVFLGGTGTGWSRWESPAVSMSLTREKLGSCSLSRAQQVRAKNRFLLGGVLQSCLNSGTTCASKRIGDRSAPRLCQAFFEKRASSANRVAFPGKGTAPEI